MENLFLMFLDHTQRRTTFGRTPLDEWSARRRDLYLTTHDTHNRQISMPPVGFEPTISAGDSRSRGVLPTVVRRCVWSRKIKNRRSIYIYIYIYIHTHTHTYTYIYIYIYDISSLRVNDLTLILRTWRKWWTPNNASKWQMGFNSAFKGLRWPVAIKRALVYT